MDLTFSALEPDYKTRLADAKVTKSGPATTAARSLLNYRERFLTVQSQTGVPALWLMPVQYREAPSIGDFSCYFGNGDPLDKPTTDVPHGRGPFSTWEAGCADALKLDHVSDATSWTWEMACWEWERWNGFGPREHGRTSGYLWSGTNEYNGGKYISDGVWSRGTWDKQLGCVAIARAIAALDADIGKGFVA